MTPQAPAGAGPPPPSAAAPGKPRKTKATSLQLQLSTSMKKLNLACRLARRLRVDDALVQLKLSPQKACRFVADGIRDAAANAAVMGMDRSKLVVGIAQPGKGQNLRRYMIHAKMKHGNVRKPRCRLYIELREGQEPRVNFKVVTPKKFAWERHREKRVLRAKWLRSEEGQAEIARVRSLA